MRSVTAATVLGAAVLGLWALNQGVTTGAAAIVLVVLVILLLLKPDSGTLFFLALAWANGPVLLGARLGGPQSVGIAILPLIAFPILVQLMRRRALVLDYPFLLMLLLLCSMLLSTLVAKDVKIALSAVFTFVTEGVVIYFLVVNAVRSLPTLRAAVWTLVLVSTLLSSLGIYQEVTHSYRSQFCGLAQRNIERMEGEEGGAQAADRKTMKLENRAGGPLGRANRFAQILMMVLPLAFILARNERKKWLKLQAAVCTLAILGGILITYSRGGFLTLAFLTVLLVFLRYIRWRDLAFGGLALVTLIMLVAPAYIQRIETFSVLPQLLSNREVVQGHGPIRGRLTEMLAAGNVFLDYPILGVGPGQYTPFYSMQYMQDPDIAFRSIDKTRRAHCLYSELAAETGLIGLLIFLVIVGSITRRLRKLRLRLRPTRPELADLATGFWLGMLGYLGTAVFLQIAYQRYLWIMVALAGATVQILEAQACELEERTPRAAAVPAATPASVFHRASLAARSQPAEGR